MIERRDRVIVVKDSRINIVEEGNPENQPIILLHGWGQNTEMMAPVVKGFEDKFHIVLIDLPGFGKSDEPTTAWTIDEYVYMVEVIVRKMKLKNPILIGHSFGGKVALEYTSYHHDVDKLIVFAPSFKAGVTDTNLKTKMLKGLKRIPLLKIFEKWAKDHMGSVDYKNASPTMKQVLVQSVTSGIEHHLGRITAPTIAIWGDLDDQVPLEQAYELEQSIPDCGLIVYPGGTHYAYLEDLRKTRQILKNFLTEKE